MQEMQETSFYKKKFVENAIFIYEIARLLFHISFSNLHKPVFTTMTNYILNMINSLPEQLKGDEHYLRYFTYYIFRCYKNNLTISDLKNDSY